MESYEPYIMQQASEDAAQYALEAIKQEKGEYKPWQ